MSRPFLVNFSAISDRSLIGRLLRLPLRIVPTEVAVPILQGPSRGMRWVVGACTHGCWLGTYEADHQELFARKVRPGDVVYDLGAHTGFYSMLASRRAGPEGAVVSFEPLPRNIAYFKRHVALNRLANVELKECLVSDTVGVARFLETEWSAMGKIDASGGLMLRSVTLDSMVASGEIRPADVIKMDIEGAELRALQGARSLLAQHHPTVFLSLHGDEQRRGCTALLEELGYTLSSVHPGVPLEESDEVLAEFPGRAS